jgi:NAD(P)-dependent dehydrogenase (short-subunit alcohol dehydrogenase family)
MSNGRSCIFVTGAASGIGRATARLFAGRAGSSARSTWTRPGSAKLREELGEDKLLHAAAGRDGQGGLRRGCGGLRSGDRRADGRAVQQRGNRTVGILRGCALRGDAAGGGREPGRRAERHSRRAAAVEGDEELAVLQHLISSRRRTAFPGIAVYSATKFAVKGLTEALSIEFERHGVRVADTLPGLIDTGILDSTPDYTRGGRRTGISATTAPKKGCSG